MVLWGGLRPILSRVLLDSAALFGLSVSAGTSECTRKNTVVLGLTYIGTFVSAGLTNRWTLTLPMVPFLFLQLTRRLSLSKKGGCWFHRIVDGLSLLLIVSAATLSILFPAVELPAIKGPYNVGVVDFFMPIESSNIAGSVSSETCASSSHVSVRLLYPTNEKPVRIPFLRPDIAADYCQQFMSFGAPPPLKTFGWLLHTWRLARMQAKPHASLSDHPDAFPLVLFSHGLGGTAEIYSYQTMSLVAHGHIVLAVNHQDGSAPVIRQRDGNIKLYDHELPKLWAGGNHVEYVRERRARTDLRVDELVAAAEGMHRLNESDLAELLLFGLSFRDRIQIDQTFFMGHSFGGATALSVAKRRPDLVKSVIAHEPAVDWMPDDARRSLFDLKRLEGLSTNFTGGTGGFLVESSDSESSIHDVDLLILFSGEWRSKKWGWNHVLEEMHQEARLGREGGYSSFAFIDDAHHTEFSDTSMMLPLWLARLTNITGPRNPLSTAKEIHERTLVFMQKVKS
jgi:pimeloyl-ACP methyl ester carboxylesterase